METNNIKKPLSLEQVLTSYNLLITFFIIFICLMVVMIKTNPKGFDNAFGYEIFITVPILLLLTLLFKEAFLFKNDPSDPWFSGNEKPSRWWIIPTALLSIIVLCIIRLFIILYNAGIISDTPPENNTSFILNFVIIALFFIITGIIYTKSKNKDDDILKTLPKAVQDTFALRTKYTVLLMLFIFITTLLYFVNPWGIMTDYGGPIIFFTLFVGIVCAILITVYQKLLATDSPSSKLNDMPSLLSFLIKGGYIIAALAISGGLIFGALKMMGVFEQDASKSDSWGHIILNLILFCTMLGIIYKLANAGGFLDKNPLYRLILNTLLYIPCIFVSIIDHISQLFSKSDSKSDSKSLSQFFKGDTKFTATKSDGKMLLISLGLLGGYFLWFFLLKPFIRRRYLTQGGKQLINQPVPTDVLTNVASYQSLAGNDTFDYRYALSFWFYADSFPPSTNSSYLKVTPILSYGENPAVKYSSETNTLFITVKENGENKPDTNKELDENMIKQWNDKITNAIEVVKTMTFGENLDAEGNRIIYSHPDVLLQKWNHIVLNYNGGTLDVFYNGKLVKSAIQVAPYIKYDFLTVGTENGVKGSVANLMYFKQPLDILTIHTLYTSLKDKNPPSIPENPQKLIPLPNV
jgi:hypothetical protein